MRERGRQHGRQQDQPGGFPGGPGSFPGGPGSDLGGPGSFLGGPRRQRLGRSCGSLTREPESRLLGGVAAGIARCRGFNPTTVRIVLALAVLFTAGVAVALYCVAWLLIPGSDGEGGAASVWSRARHDSRGMTLAAGVASLVVVILVLAGVLRANIIDRYGWPQVLSAACLVLIWRNGAPGERAALRRAIAPIESLRPGSGRRAAVARVAVAVVLAAAGLALVASTRHGVSLLRPLGGVILLLGGLVVLLGPWWLRIAQDLVVERAARARAEERADIAARVHDSVLQTLALIQRRAEDPAQVVKLARAQERELRSWLFEGRTPGVVADVATVAEGARQIQQDAEDRHGVPVEVVTVGDCPLDDDLRALLEAAREAVVNAAKWSGASVISLYAEVSEQDVQVVVRDRGKGFDPDAVPADRKGLAESVRGRMSRHGGTAVLAAAVGEGTKVTLTMPRALARSARSAS